jgi:hypothetical protein
VSFSSFFTSDFGLVGRKAGGKNGSGAFFSCCGLTSGSNIFGKSSFFSSTFLTSTSSKIISSFFFSSSISLMNFSSSFFLLTSSRPRDSKSTLTSFGSKGCNSFFLFSRSAVISSRD